MQEDREPGKLPAEGLLTPATASPDEDVWTISNATDLQKRKQLLYLHDAYIATVHVLTTTTAQMTVVTNIMQEDIEYKTLCELNASHLHTLKDLHNIKIFDSAVWTGSIQPRVKLLEKSGKPTLPTHQAYRQACSS